MKNNIDELMVKIKNDIENASVAIMQEYLKKTVEFERISADQSTEKFTGKVVFATLDYSFARWFEILGNNHIKVTESRRSINIVLMVELSDGKITHISADRVKVIFGID